jgi:hypothetical protein
MPQIGTLWPHSPQQAAVYQIVASHQVVTAGPLGPGAISLLLDGGGRPAGVLALSEAGARQLVRDLVALLGSEPSTPPVEVKQAVEVKPEAKPEVKPPAKRP